MLAKGGLGACRGRRADPVSTWLGLDLVSNAAQEPRTPLPSTVACSFSLVLLLRARPTQPTEGTAVTLTCETWPPPQQAHVPLQFRFFRDDRALQPGWSRSPELQVAAVWSEDSRSYWCEAQAAGSVIGRSRPIQVQVQSERPAGPGAGPGWGGAVGLGRAGPGRGLSGRGRGACGGAWVGRGRRGLGGLGGLPSASAAPEQQGMSGGAGAPQLRPVGAWATFPLLALPIGANGTFRKCPLRVFTGLQSGTALTRSGHSPGTWTPKGTCSVATRSPLVTGHSEQGETQPRREAEASGKGSWKGVPDREIKRKGEVL